MSSSDELLTWHRSVAAYRDRWEGGGGGYGSIGRRGLMYQIYLQCWNNEKKVVFSYLSSSRDIGILPGVMVRQMLGWKAQDFRPEWTIFITKSDKDDFYHYMHYYLTCVSSIFHDLFCSVLSIAKEICVGNCACFSMENKLCFK